MLIASVDYCFKLSLHYTVYHFIYAWGAANLFVPVFSNDLRIRNFSVFSISRKVFGLANACGTSQSFPLFTVFLEEFDYTARLQRV